MIDQKRQAQKFPHTEYIFETESGCWRIKPKHGFEKAVFDILWKITIWRKMDFK